MIVTNGPTITVSIGQVDGTVVPFRYSSVNGKRWKRRRLAEKAYWLRMGGCGHLMEMYSLPRQYLFDFPQIWY